LTSTHLQTIRPMRITAMAGAAALIAMAVAGCGSSGNKGGDITGVQTGSPTAAASPSPSASAPAGAPPIALPSDLTVEIQFKPSGDASKDAVSEALGYALKAYNEGMAKGDPQTPAVKYAYYSTGGAYMANIINQLVGRNQTITGTSRYYAPAVTVNDATHAVVNFCEDQTKGFAKDKATGKVLTTTPSLTDYWAWNMGLEQVDGVWRVAHAEGTKGSQQCQNS